MIHFREIFITLKNLTLYNYAALKTTTFVHITYLYGLFPTAV